MTGSDNEPLEAADAAVQMRDATARLRDKAWMVAPMTSALPETPDSSEVEV